MSRHAREYRRLIEACIPVEERLAYQQTSIGQTLWTFFHIWLGLGVAFYTITLLVAAPLVIHLLLGPLVVVFIATRINALAVQIHEASHGLLMPNRRANDIFCNFFGAYWILNDVASYWEVHRHHHSHLHHHTADPDLPLYMLPRGDRWGIFKLLLSDLFWVTSIRRALTYGRVKQDATLKSSGFAPKVIFQVIILAGFLHAFGLPSGPFLYFIYWCVPLLSIFPLIVRFRIVTEHYHELLHEDSTIFVSRTSVSSALEEYFIGSAMEYHLEHHLFPKIPYHQLKRLHRRLVAEGFFEQFGSESQNLLSGGYAKYWYQLLFCPGQFRQNNDED